VCKYAKLTLDKLLFPYHFIKKYNVVKERILQNYPRLKKEPVGNPDRATQWRGT
jgi:hypothetical protein